MNRLFEGLGRFVVRFRFLVLGIWILVAIVSSKTLPSLGSQVNNNNSEFLPASAPSSRANVLATPLLGDPNTQTQIFLVAARANGTLGVADAAAISREVAAARHVPLVLSARALGIAPSGHAAEILLQVKVKFADVATQTTVVKRIEATFATIHAPPGLALHLAGDIATNVANQDASNKTGNRTQTFSFLLIIVLLLVIFRSLLAPLVTLLPAGVALVVANRFIGGLGAHGLKISEITQLLLIVLLLGAGTDYGLFLVFRVREEIRRGLEPKEAVVHALVRVGESISASAGTVVFALLSLVFASFGIYKDLGVPLALGVAVMLIAGLTLLPALLAICGRALFWPGGTGYGRRGPNADGMWGRVAAPLVRRPAITLAIGVAVFAGLAAAALGYHSSGFGGALNAPVGSDAAKGNALSARYFPQTSSNPANLVLAYPRSIFVDPVALERATTALARSGDFIQLAGPLNPNGHVLSPALFARLHASLGDPRLLPALPGASASGFSAADYQAYRATSQFVSVDGRTIQFEATLRAGPQQSVAALDATPTIRAVVAKAAADSGASASGVAGQAAALYDVSNTSNHDLLTIVPIAILAIALLLALVLRSLIAPLYLIVSVALSYLAALGVSTLVFIDLGHGEGLTFILPFLMFIFLLALGEDYNILVMTRIREEAHRLPLREAVVRAVGRTGPTVTSAGVILAGTFGVLAIAGNTGPSGSQIRDIGFGLAIGILMDTFLVRTLLVPSTVALLGSWNWWPSRVAVDEVDSDDEDPGMSKDLPGSGPPAEVGVASTIE